MKVYHLIIVGGGISGVYFAYRYNKQFPGRKIALIEKYKELGGRLATSYTPDGQYERGGARFNDNHHVLLSLIRKFGKTKVPIDSYYRFIPKAKKYCKNPYDFPALWEIVKRDIFNKKTKRKLIDNTLYDLLVEEKGKEFAELFLHIFNYESELSWMSAHLARLLFEEDIRPDLQFYVLKEGLQSLVKDMAKSISSIDIYLNEEVKHYHHINNRQGHMISTTNKDEESKIYISSQIAFACSRPGIQNIVGLPGVDRYISLSRDKSLHRIFAKYPINENTGEVWFANLPKIKTDSPLGFIIPQNKETGLIQISYTDGKRSDYWKWHHKKGSLKRTIERELNVLFPDITIPEPEYIKSYYWKHGGTFWHTGVDVGKFVLSFRDKQASEGRFFVGEAVSMRPAWVEGGLRTVDYAFDNHMR
jgi:hypothetical protein